MTKRAIRAASQFFLLLVSLIFLVIYLYPILIIFISSVKPKVDLAINPFGLPKTITFQYFVAAFNKMNYLQSTVNTFTIVLITVPLTLIMAAMAAYAISRRGGKGYNSLYNIFLAGMLIPFQMTMIPLYKFLLTLHLINSLWGVICVYLATLSPFSIFILSGFVRTVPKELEEAAYIDGCGLYRTFFTIVFPLLKGPLTTVAVLNTFSIWNDFLMPMLYLQSPDKKTLTVQLSSFQGMYFNDWSLIFAGVCMIVLPMLIIYLIAQKFIINGITAGAVKG